MLTTRTALALLREVTAGGSLKALTQALRFGPALPIDRSTREALGIPPDAARARVSRATGTLRLLTVELPTAEAASCIRLARTMARQSSAMLWLLIVRGREDGTMVIAAPAPAGADQIPALVVRGTTLRESDGETLAQLAGIDGPDTITHLRWRETLGRDALTRRFYRDLETSVASLASSAVGGVPNAVCRTIALLQLSRLLFLSFLEAKGWMDGDRCFLRREMDRIGTGLHRRLLDPLFFGTLNTPSRKRAAAARAFGRVPFLNGGLFTRTPLERRWRQLRFADAPIAETIAHLLGRYRVTAHETTSEWSDAAIDPEMLGRAFESLMGTRERKSSGSFYTPHALIVHVTDESLDSLFAGQQPTLAGIAELRILDPACGSGSFLVHLLERVADLAARAGDVRPVATRRREILARSIFGVDRDPIAVWLCQLRLWLSVVVEEDTADPSRVAPLPNLDRNIREGDALAGEINAEARRLGAAPLERLRLRYVRASGARKRTLARALEREERTRAIQRVEGQLATLKAQRHDLLAMARSPDLFSARATLSPLSAQRLETLKRATRERRTLAAALRIGAALPFDFATHFADPIARGGFSLVIGNPPWVRLHQIPPAERLALRARFRVFREAAWREGAAGAAAGRGFAEQADLAALFTERALALATAHGTIALLLPAKLWSALAGGGVRRLILEEAELVLLEDYSNARAAFDAAVYPALLVARRRAHEPSDHVSTATAESERESRITIHRGPLALHWSIPTRALPLDATPGAPWLLIPPEVRAAFDRLSSVSVPLGHSALGRPLLGVKTGCNEAFLVRIAELSGRATHRHARSGTCEGPIESDRLRPSLRGEQLRPWQPEQSTEEESIIWTHDANDVPLALLPPGTARWMHHWRRRLESRTDQRGSRWWALFRTESARADRARVVWGDIGRTPRAVVLPKGDQTVPLNSCYVMPLAEEDAYTLAALLNSSIAAAWLSVLATPARGGYHRFLGWTCARLPLPRDWERARLLLAPIGRRACAGDPPSQSELDAAVLRAYRLRADHLAPLLSWLPREH